MFCPRWPNGAESILDVGYKIRTPKGTVIYTGEVAPQGGYYLGGTKQVLIQKPWLLEGIEILEKYPLVK